MELAVKTSWRYLESLVCFSKGWGQSTIHWALFAVWILLTNNFFLPHGATLRLIFMPQGNPPVLSNNLLFCLWTSAASWLWSRVMSVGTLGDLLALWQYRHCSLGGFGFGPQVFQDSSLGKWLLPGIPKNLPWKASQCMAAVKCGSSVLTRAGKSLRAVNAERLSWGAMDASSAWSTGFWGCWAPVGIALS